ncbi:hypothetical protein [Agathobaculum sp.]|uniref:hypothetical protein n=1 Tax=Agathobaculum sp. TaxID=2048138 RepID=UPI003AB5BEA8
MSKPNGILAMNPERYREIDGVVFDLDSYARHCKPASEEPPSQTDEAPSAAPAPVFAVDPYPDGWYPAEDGRPPVPVMGGALPPCESESDVIREENGVKTVVQTVYYAPGSGSGSGSYTTSYTTSFRSSGSGSGGSYVFGSCVYTVGGYGLELI